MISTSTIAMKIDPEDAKRDFLRDLALLKGTFYPVGVMMGCAIVLVNREGVIEIRSPGYDPVQVPIDHPWIQGTTFERKIRDFLDESRTHK